jgi:hypothetical protein
MIEIHQHHVLKASAGQSISNETANTACPHKANPQAG